MSDGSYPSIGLKFDLNEVVRGQAALSALTASYQEVGTAAAAAGAAVNQAAATKVTSAKSADAETVASAKAAAKAKVDAEAAAEETIQAFLYDRLINEQRLREANLQANSQALSQEIAEEQAAQNLMEQMMLDRVNFDRRAREAQVLAAQQAAEAEIAAAAAAGVEQAKVDAATLRSKVSLNQQRLQEYNALTKAEQKAEEDTKKAVIRAAQDAAAQEQKIAQSTFDFRRRMTMQQAKEEATAAAPASATAADKFLANLAQQVATLNQGKAGLAAYKAEQLGVAAEAAPFIQALKDGEVAVAHVGATSLKTRESLVILREGIRGDFTRMAGSASILANAYGILPLLLNPITIGLVAVAAAVGTVAYAMSKGSDEAAKYENYLVLTNHYAGLTASGVEEMSARIQAASGANALSTQRGIETLVESGKFTADTIELMVSTAQRFSQFTGESVDKILADYERAKGGVVKYAVQHEEAYHDITLAQIDYIQELEKEGKHHDAENQFFQDIHDNIYGKAAPAYGYLQGIIHGVTDAASNMWAALMNWGAPQTLDDRIVDAGDKLRKAMTAVTAPDGGFRANQTSRTPQNKMAAVLKAQKDFSDLVDQKTMQDTVDDIQAKWAQANDDAVRQKYDNQAKKIRTPKDKGDGGAQSQIDQLTASVTSLNKQLDQASSYDTSPLADDAAKITQAYSTMLAKFGDSNNAKKQALAIDAANLAADKERLTISVQLASAYVKEGAAEALKIQQAAVSTAAIDAEHASINAYYLDSTAGVDDYVKALADQSSAMLKAENDNADLALAQKSGATSLNDISVALQTQLGLSKERADQIQAEAQRTAALTHEVNTLADAQKALAASADLHTANLAQIRDLEDEAAAYRAGAQAIVAYEQRKALLASLKGTVLSTATGNDAQDVLNALVNQANAQAASDEQHRIAVQQNLVDVGKLNDAQKESLLLATLTTQQRSVETEVLARMHDLMAANAGLSEQEARNEATSAALANKRLKDAADLKIQLQDSMEQAFIDTGKIDFSTISDGIFKAAKKALYEALIQKPIDIIINAAVNFETQAINQLLGGLTGGSGNSLASLFGGQGADASSLAKQFAGTWGNAGSATNAVSGAASSLTSAASSLSSMLGPALAVSALGSSAAAGLVKLFGGDAQAQQRAAAGGAVGGVVGGIINALLGDHSGHATAAVFNTQGQYISNALSPKGSTQATIDAAGQIGNATQALIAQFKTLGINADGVIASIEQGTRNDNRLFLQNGTEISSPQGDATTLQNNITKALYQYGTYSNAQEQKVVEQLLNMNATLDQINTAVQAFQQAQTDYTNVTNGLLAFTDPAAAAAASIQAQQIARRQTLQADITAGYFSPEQIAQLAADLPQLEQKEIEQALSGVATAAGGAAHSLQDFQTAQQKLIDFVTSLQSGALSPLSPADQLAADQANFGTQSALAKGGNYDALQGLSTVAQTYLTDAQKFFGSGQAYAAVFNSVTAALTDVGTTAATDPQVAAIQAAEAALQAAITASGLAIVAAINDNQTAGTGAITGAVAGATEAQTAAATAAAAAIYAGISNVVGYNSLLAGGRIA